MRSTASSGTCLQQYEALRAAATCRCWMQLLPATCNPCQRLRRPTGQHLLSSQGPVTWCYSQHGSLCSILLPLSQLGPAGLKAINLKVTFCVAKSNSTRLMLMPLPFHPAASAPAERAVSAAPCTAEPAEAGGPAAAAAQHSRAGCSNRIHCSSS